MQIFKLLESDDQSVFGEMVLRWTEQMRTGVNRHGL